MDTREKIIEPARAREIARELCSRLTLVTGYFDVLRTGHVERLQQLARSGNRLKVAVLDPPQPILSRRARAELVAALAMVDYVVPAGQDGFQDLLNEFPAEAIAREEASDLPRTQELTAHVQRRHSG
jgi:bifunctional ADP-heptose synthase (sugar kinase/adenylyltransferase)